MEKYFKGFGTLTLKNKNFLSLIIDVEEGYVTTLEDVDVFYDALTEWVKNIEGKYIMLADTTKGKWMKGEVRVQLSRRQKVFESIYFSKQIKVILVVSSPIIRVILKGINLVAKPAVESVTFSKLEDAMEEVERELQKIV